MDDYESLSHSVWDCKYHVVFIPKYRKKTLYGELRQQGRECRDLWRREDLGADLGLRLSLAPHASALFKLSAP
jgi:putative transposase